MSALAYFGLIQPVHDWSTIGIVFFLIFLFIFVIIIGGVFLIPYFFFLSDIGDAIDNFIICIEMMLISLCHMYVFSYIPYKVTDSERAALLVSFFFFFFFFFLYFISSYHFPFPFLHQLFIFFFFFRETQKKKLPAFSMLLLTLQTFGVKPLRFVSLPFPSLLFCSSFSSSLPFFHSFLIFFFFFFKNRPL